jgi:hypothetical protein
MKKKRKKVLPPWRPFFKTTLKGVSVFESTIIYLIISKCQMNRHFGGAWIFCQMIRTPSGNLSTQKAMFEDVENYYDRDREKKEHK